MAKVKELVEEVRQEVLDLFHEYGVIPIEDVKQILKNEYFFQNKNKAQKSKVRRIKTLLERF